MDMKRNEEFAPLIGGGIPPRVDACDVATAARKIFGADAALAVAFSAIDARLDGRDSDFRFWTSVFHTLTRN
ncbi:hypothetical protein G6L37_32965 [Agrobacterium rubi]|uniref:hypothetical protein n=1 Tax=Agrobacterium rubi TaxID=28099 RepID=UPI0015738845|nr:hypothetical protein [Agrobacterium rubi]NTF10788.1 hypothetical protein [Agrobacterium rubi]NTF23203.1 hypothetical protein [Agrobacterium rubi]NTF30123.1 hypothetical protein [Agrobacterium rubi]